MVRKMISLNNAPLFMAGIAIFVGAHNLMVYSRLRQRQTYLSFAITCFLVGLYDITCAGQYNAISSIEAGPWQQAETAVLLLAGAALTIFFYQYTEKKSDGVRNVLIAFFSIFAILAIINPSNMLWDPAKPTARVVPLPWESQITYYGFEAGILYEVLAVILFGVYLYVARIVVHFSRSGHVKEAKPLLIALVIFFAGVTNDTLVAIGVYKFIFLTEYAYFGIVLLVTYNISTTLARTVAVQEALHASE